MALFFDALWYDQRLDARGLTRSVLAAVAGMAESELTLAFKDQRELSMREINAFAELLGVSPTEAASRAGVRPASLGDQDRIAALEARVAALEGQLAMLAR